MNDRIDDNPLVETSRLRTWADEASDYMEDDDFRDVLNKVTRIIAGEMPEPSKIAAVCARLEAYAIKFRMEFVAYMSYKKGTTEANMRKNHYKELYTGIDRLVDALKYVMK